jgi:ABC-type transport system substrate-binding protein
MKITEVVPGEYYVMEPNEHYWGPQPKISRVKVLFVSDDWNTILTAFANEELDMVQARFEGQTARQALSDPYMESNIVEAPHWGINQIWITPNQPLDCVHVRRAFSMAIDRGALINIMNAGAPRELWKPLNMHRNPAVPHCQEETAQVTMLPFDPEKAKEELEQSEYWPDVVDMEIHMWAGNAEIVPRLEAVQKMLVDNLGMTNIIIHTEELADWLNPPFPMHLWWNGQTPHAAYLLGTLANMIDQSKIIEYQGPPLTDERVPTISVAHIEGLRELMDKALATTDMDEQCEYVRQFGQLWNDDVLSLDMAIPVTYQLVAPWVKDWEFFPGAFNEPMNFENWWIAEH